MATEHEELDNKTWPRKTGYPSQVNPVFSVHLLHSSSKRGGE